MLETGRAGTPPAPSLPRWLEVGPRDPVTFVVAGSLLAVIGLVALLVPALRATRADPIAKLRHE